MVKTVIDSETQRYLEVGIDIERDFLNAMAPIFDSWVATGYGERQIGLIAVEAAIQLMYTKVLDRHAPKA